MKNNLKSKIREIPDWPQKGISFKDITPLLQDSRAFQDMIDELARPYLKKKIDPVKSCKAGISPKAKLFNRVDKVVGIDARGFIIAAALAYKLKAGLAVVRKKGKLPFRTVSRSYALEYGSNTIEMHRDAILPGERVLLVDDVLATGGTMKAAVDMVEKLKGKIISVDFLIELNYLNGRKKLRGYRVRSLIEFEN